MATPELIEVDNVVDIINCESRQVKTLKALKETVR